MRGKLVERGVFMRLGRSVLLTLAIVAAAGVAATLSSATAEEQGPVPEEQIRYVAALTAMNLTNRHYEPQRIDDELSRRWFGLYVDSLDYNQMWLTRADLDEFEARFGTMLDDDLKRGQPSLEGAHDIFERYRDRLDERVVWVQKTLAAPLDLTNEESWATDRGKDAWADGAALDELWRQRLEAEVLSMVLAGRPQDDAQKRLAARYQRLAHDVDDWDAMDVVERYLTALGNAYDPHSAYFKPITNENFDISMRDSLEGIGAVLKIDGPYVVVDELVAGGPADRGKELQANDRIVAVAQGDGEPVDVIDMRLDKVVQLIRGKKGTVVKLTVFPAAETDPAKTRTVSITRDEVVLAEAAAKGKVVDVPGDSGAPLKIGVIDVPSFYIDSDAAERGEPEYRSASRDVRRILRDFQAQGVDAVVVDLRNNGGGSLRESVDLTGLFIGRGPVVQVRSRDTGVEPLRDGDPDEVWSGPVVVLTSALSASASEIFAAAIQDYHRGLVVGAEATHGKGTVQSVVGLDPMLTRLVGRDARPAGALKFTTGKFYRVSGGSTQNKGVLADVVLPSPFDGMDIREGDLDFALAYDEISEVRHPVYDLPVDVAKLRDASAKRIANDLEFKFLLDDVARRKAEEKTPISLKLQTRQGELKAEEERGAARDAERVAAGRPAIRGLTDADELPDPVLDEALNVTRDYVAQVRAKSG
jgi:carboxyl-terminal processing protease